jgi:putative tryptophan/tyrosine transport system ATP-binding protein
MIRVSDAHVTFNKGTPLEAEALKGVNLNIKAGDFITVIGSNGAGKSTLLNLLAGDIECERGTILIDDKNVTKWSSAKRAKMVARVFQDPMVGTCAELTVEENLALGYRRGISRGFRPALKPELREEFRAQIRRLGLGLESRLQDPIGALSGGQRQALSLLMAVLRPMKILLLDEHIAALDPKTSRFVMDLTKAIVAERNLTALMVTHSMHDAIESGNRTLMLDSGRIILDISGKDREGLGVKDFLNLFEEARGEKVTDDALLLD